MRWRSAEILHDGLGNQVTLKRMARKCLSNRGATGVNHSLVTHLCFPTQAGIDCVQLAQSTGAWHAHWHLFAGGSPCLCALYELCLSPPSPLLKFSPSFIVADILPLIVADILLLNLDDTYYLTIVDTHFHCCNNS